MLKSLLKLPLARMLITRDRQERNTKFIDLYLKYMEENSRKVTWD